MGEGIAGELARGGIPYPRWLTGVLKRAVLRKLVSLRAGALTLVDEQGAVHRFGDPAGELRATLTVRDPSFYGALGLGGSVGAGESYFRGAWDTDGLVDLVRLMARNSDVLSQLDGGFARLGRLLYNAFHWRHANTVAGSRANILAHYDLGNDFFELMLDDSMMYSSAIYADEAMALPAAQAHKLKIICEKLRLDSSHHLLEIGTGWGGLACFAAKETGCRVTTTTISDAQFAYATARVRAAGLEDRVTVLKQDYRVLTGRFDRIVSIEMIEAVGDQFFTTYFRKLDSLLAEDGLLLIQGITIADQRYERYRRSVDFIKRFVFPGGCLPSLTAITQCMTQVTSLRLRHLDDIGEHYARTLRDWRERFEAAGDVLRARGYDTPFLRLWRFYLAYCEGGFRERTIGDLQLLFEKPDSRALAPIYGVKGDFRPC